MISQKPTIEEIRENINELEDVIFGITDDDMIPY